MSDHSEQPVRQVEPEIEKKANEAPHALAPGTTEVPVAPPAREDKELLDYEASPESSNMEINVVRFSDDYLVISEEETTHLEFGPREAVF